MTPQLHMMNTELGVDYQVLFNWAVGGVGVLAGALFKAMWDAIKNMQTSIKDMQKADRDLTDKVAAVEVLVAGQYVKRDEYREDMGNIFGKLDTIISVLNGKADR